ncbi:MAG: glucose-1-phosphate cytidylyltransferase [Magnetococcales bacterium]|nr:glucose-1-phosphate cytidylyltransferase [Magnetococcales bacterium]MBF0151900.1 glucose-1-phosphate cytidylyltransferase [Magnetococcales bacterium]MBF0632189.1 glucose-1-phosphate cytidylyltransferase [Magnetococcales bacterium]
MKVVILAGGLGTRLSEETDLRPKPMVSIGNMPILWHIMKIYSTFGLNDFIICLGYKGYMIKEYFANYALHVSEISIDLEKQKIDFLENMAEPWRITLVDTGANTMTGGRLKRIRKYLKEDENFHMTYGDGVGNVNIRELMRFHEQQNTLATMTATRPAGRFGMIKTEGDLVTSFQEKPEGEGWINGGFFILSPKVLDYVAGDDTMWEREPLETLSRLHQVSVYRHEGFWEPMDTLRDKNHLESLWNGGKAPWKIW